MSLNSHHRGANVSPSTEESGGQDRHSSGQGMNYSTLMCSRSTCSSLSLCSWHLRGHVPCSYVYVEVSVMYHCGRDGLFSHSLFILLVLDP